MTLIESTRYLVELNIAMEFIAKDSPIRALKFQDDITQKIHTIPQNPYMFRKRTTKNDNHIRELIFKGYTVPFYIDTEKNRIIILGIFNQNQWEE